MSFCTSLQLVSWGPRSEFFGVQQRVSGGSLYHVLEGFWDIFLISPATSLGVLVAAFWGLRSMFPAVPQCVSLYPQQVSWRVRDLFLVVPHGVPEDRYNAFSCVTAASFRGIAQHVLRVGGGDVLAMRFWVSPQRISRKWLWSLRGTRMGRVHTGASKIPDECENVSRRVMCSPEYAGNDIPGEGFREDRNENEGKKIFYANRTSSIP